MNRQVNIIGNFKRNLSIHPFILKARLWFIVIIVAAVFKVKQLSNIRTSLRIKPRRNFGINFVILINFRRAQRPVPARGLPKTINPNSGKPVATRKSWGVALKRARRSSIGQWTIDDLVRVRTCESFQLHVHRKLAFQFLPLYNNSRLSWPL